MRWLLWALWALWGGVPGGGGCILCSQEAAEALAELLGPFLHRALPRQPLMRARAGTLLLQGVLGLGRLPHHPDTFMGVIDEATLEEASIHFRRTMARVMEQNPQDQKLFPELLWAMREVKDNFERLMRRFQREVYCINNCGRMEVVWIECIFCNITLFTCDRARHCGERQLRVQEGEDLLLDCGLAWHRAAHGTKIYRFYRLPGTPPASPGPPPGRAGGGGAPPGEELLASGAAPVLLWKAAGAGAGGRYRCEMRNPRGEIGSELSFRVTVSPRWRPPTRPPPGPARLPPLAAAAAALAAALAAVAVAATCFHLRRRRRTSVGTAPN